MYVSLCFGNIIVRTKQGVITIRISVNDELNIVQIWANRSDTISIKDIITPPKYKNYKMVIYRSGDTKLYRATRDILAYNKENSTD